MERKTFRSEVSLDQWLAIVAVADGGGLHAAGRQIGRSHSAIAEAVHKAEGALGLTLFAVVGRSLRPTDEGLVVVHRARELLASADALERSAQLIGLGWEGEIQLVVDGIVPMSWLAPRLERFAEEGRGTRLRLRHEVKLGAARAVALGDDDIVLTGTLPLGATPDPVLDVPFTPVAAPAVAAALRGGRPVRQLVVSDTAEPKDVSGWLRPFERWAVPSFDAAVALALRGLGLCVAPRPWVDDDLQTGRLISLADGAHPFVVQVHRQLPRGDGTGPAARLLARCLGPDGRPPG